MKTRMIHSADWLRNMIQLKQLAFDRAFDRWDVDGMNIACAQKKYYELELEMSVIEPLAKLESK